MLTRRQRLLFLTPLVLLLVPFLLWPALFGLLGSFTNYAPFQIIPLRFVGLNNYARLLQDHDFQISVRNIAVFTILTVTGELILGLGLAYALRKPFRGRSIVRVILLLPWLISAVANGVMWHFLLNTDSGIINYGVGLLHLPRLPSPLDGGMALSTLIAVEIWRKAPLVSFLVLPGLLHIPAVQWDNADLEGFSTLTRIRHVVVPRVRLLLLTITLLLIGDALGTSESVLVLTGGGPGSETMTPGLFSYIQAIRVFDWGQGATSAWLIAAAVLIIGAFYLFLSRREVQP